MIATKNAFDGPGGESLEAGSGVRVYINARLLAAVESIHTAPQILDELFLFRLESALHYLAHVAQRETAVCAGSLDPKKVNRPGGERSPDASCLIESSRCVGAHSRRPPSRRWATARVGYPDGPL